MSLFRNLPEDGTIEIYINTVDSTGAPVAPSSAFAASDFAIHKDGSATEKATTNGITVTSPFDSETGLHLLVIDTSNDTGDAGFWATGSRYQVRFNTTKTVDSVSIDGRCVPNGAFGIQSEYMRGTDGANTTTPLDAAGVRTAVGLASANLDTQIGTLATASALSVVDGIVDAILVDTGTSIPATLTSIAADADTAATEATANGVTLINAFPTNFSSLLINGSGHLSRVTLVDTTTANTDMVAEAPTASEIGTAFLATALSKGTAGTIERAFWQILKTQAVADGQAAGTPAVGAFDTNLTAADGVYDHQLLLFTSGSLAGEARPIATYVNASGRITLQESLTSAPSASDEFIIVPQHIHPVSEIQSGLATATELAKAVDRGGYCLTILAGAVSDAQTAAATYTLTLDATVHTVTYAGLTSAGVRTAPTLNKA